MRDEGWGWCLQYHGKLGVDAIESIFIPEAELRKVNMTVLNAFRDANF
jgi:hypothetical protein